MAAIRRWVLVLPPAGSFDSTIFPRACVYGSRLQINIAQIMSVARRLVIGIAILSREFLGRHSTAEYLRLTGIILLGRWEALAQLVWSNSRQRVCCRKSGAIITRQDVDGRLEVTNSLLG